MSITTSITTRIQCDGCGNTRVLPYTTCFVCEKEARREEEKKFRAEALDAHTLFLDGYNDDLVAVICDADNEHPWIFVWVRGAGMALRMAPNRTREDAVSDAMRLRDENTQLLAENARLRRSFEKATRVKGTGGG